MAVRLDPWQNIVEVGWPSADVPQNGVFLLRLYMDDWPLVESGSFADFKFGLSNYITPEPGQIPYLRIPESHKIKLLDSLPRSGSFVPSWVYENEGATSGAAAGFDHMRGFAMHSRFYENILAGSGFGQRVAGPETGIAIALWPTQNAPVMEDWTIPYRLEWETYWGANVDVGEIWPVYAPGTFNATHYEYRGDYEVKQEGGANFTESFQAHAFHTFPDGQWLLKHVWTFNETTGALSGPDYEY